MAHKQSSVTPAQQQETASKVMTAADFVSSAPLFVSVSVEEFYAPRTMDFECPGVCGKETTWSIFYQPSTLRGADDERNLIPDSAIKSVSYRCARCGNQTLTIIYREVRQKEVQGPPGFPPARQFGQLVTGVMKVGQYPEPSIYVPPGLQKTLGNDATKLYRRALMSRNNGFGLAAVAYMRRVVEDQTNALIQTAAQYAEEFGANPEAVAQMRATVDQSKYTRYEDKLKVAATVFPENLKVGPINPLQLLFSGVSKGLHGLNEQKCIEIADEIRAVFEFVFENLRAQIADRQAFVDKVRELS